MAKRQPKKVSVENLGIKKLTIFDHISNITANKTDWKDYNETDIKSFEPYMINRFLSMDFNLIEIINLFQKYTIGFLDKREVFKLYSGILPKKKYFLRYVKSTNEGTYQSELIDYMSKYFETSKRDVVEYLDIYYLTESGILEVQEILRKYGLEEKKIKALLKLKK